jgi:membrane associated rhomboid family serine protease
LVYLWVFGVKVEGRIGAWRFLGLYLLCGIAGTAGHLMVNSDSTAPVLGAGGAIAGLLGAYLILYRESGTAFTLRLFYPFHEVPVPASFLVVLWIGLQFFFGTMPIMVAPDQTSSAGWLVAICGFAAGLAFAFPFRKQGQKKPALKLSHSGTPDIWYALYQNKGGLDRDWR